MGGGAMQGGLCVPYAGQLRYILCLHAHARIRKQCQSFVLFYSAYQRLFYEQNDVRVTHTPTQATMSHIMRMGPSAAPSGLAQHSSGEASTSYPLLPMKLRLGRLCSAAGSPGRPARMRLQEVRVGAAVWLASRNRAHNRAAADNHVAK